jgi:beta-glucosidase
VKLHGHRRLLTEVLKDELGFDGFVISDWLGIDQLDGDPYQCVVQALNAGIDMVMVPFEFRRFIDNVVAAVDKGDVAIERLDDAVTRILRVKRALGLFDPGQELPPADVVGCDDHRRLGREAVAASVVRLKDPDRVLPLRSGRVLVAGAAADDIGLQCGGWTIEWQGGTGPITAGTTIVDGLRAADAGLEIDYTPDGCVTAGQGAPVGVVVVAEPPYSEGAGDRADLGLTADQIELIERVDQVVDRLVLVVVSGRPMVLETVEHRCDAIVAAWLPGTEGGGVADVLTGAKPFVGRLPRPWPRSADEVSNPRKEDESTWTWTFGHSVMS